jgi:hypothetical protein
MSSGGEPGPLVEYVKLSPVCLTGLGPLEHFSPFTVQVSLFLLCLAASQLFLAHFRQALLDCIQGEVGIRTLGRNHNLGAGTNIGRHNVHDADGRTKTPVSLQRNRALKTHRATNQLAGWASVQASGIGYLHLPT